MNNLPYAQWETLRKIAELSHSCALSPPPPDLNRRIQEIQGLYSTLPADLVALAQGAPAQPQAQQLVNLSAGPASAHLALDGTPWTPADEENYDLYCLSANVIDPNSEWARRMAQRPAVGETAATGKTPAAVRQQQSATDHDHSADSDDLINLAASMGLPVLTAS